MNKLIKWGLIVAAIGVGILVAYYGGLGFLLWWEYRKSGGI